MPQEFPTVQMSHNLKKKSSTEVGKKLTSIIPQILNGQTQRQHKSCISQQKEPRKAQTKERKPTKLHAH